MRYSDLKRKLFAITAIALMLSVSVIPMLSVQDSDAASGDGGTYSYTITYDSSLMSSTSAAISVDDMDAIYHPSYDGTTTTGYGDWTWDTSTGLGPFNSFYAAFDLYNENEMVARLNPFDLTETISGESIASEMYHYNIMWVLPTVYWLIGDSGNELTLTNDPNAGGVAYGHMIDGHVYNYIAYGVYEGVVDQIIDGGTYKYVLSSRSGVAPSTSIKPSVFRTYANNNDMSESLSDGTYDAYSMIMTFSQWQLYRWCSLTLMEDFNSQDVVGAGKAYTSTNLINYNTTGLLDSAGPYAGEPLTDSTDSCLQSEKLFIENAWGSVWDAIDGAVVVWEESSETLANAATLYIDLNSVPTFTTSTGTNIYTSTNDFRTGTFYPTSILTQAGSTVTDTDLLLWGFPDVGHSGYNKGVADSFTGVSKIASGSGTTYTSTMYVGGVSATSLSNARGCGINCVSASTSGYFDRSGAVIGARLTFVFDEALDYSVITWDVDGTETQVGYIVGDTPTIDDPTKSGYTFAGWTPTVVAVTGDATYTATWNLMVYTVTWDANGGAVSPAYSIGSAESAVTMPTPTRSDYDFVGWYTDPDDGTKIRSPYYPTEDITLYAHWETGLEVELSDLFFPLVVTVLIFTMMLMLYRSGELTATQLVTATIGSAAALLIMFQFLFPVL